MKKFILKFLVPLIKLIPLTVRIKFFYFIKFRRFPKLSKPMLYTEKLQCRKLNMKSEYSLLSDKYQVRGFVTEKVGKEHLVQLYGVFNHFSEIDFNSLPNKFVIKTNFGSGSEHLEIVTDKFAINWPATEQKFNEAMASSYIGAILGETQYDDIPKKIIVEEYIENNGEDLADFKFHLFSNGNGFLQIDFDRFSDHKRNLYDLSFNKLDDELLFPSGDYVLPLHEHLVELKEVATKLAKGFDYVRVDLYLANNTVLFGEMTFTPGSGFEPFSSTSTDLKYGSYWR